MALKLGEMLVRNSIITLDQLEEALKYQVIFGGKLGTNLIELGYLDEEAIARFLSEKIGVPYVHHDRLMDIPANVIKRIPPDLAKKYRVIPLSIEKKRLMLVMADPSDLSAIDEISFITGFSIQPVVAPEVRLILALEKYYGIERDLRYIPIIERVEKKGKTVKRTGEKPVKKIETPLQQKPAEKKAPTREPDIIELEDIIAEEKTRKGIIEQYSIDDLSQALAKSENREEIADIIVKYAGKGYGRAALFLIKNNNAAGWGAINNGKKVEGFESLQISLDTPSVLKTVVEGKSYYLGPLRDNENNSAIIGCIGGDFPMATLIVPVIMMGKVVSVLYADGGRKDLGETVSELQRLANKAAMAFEILILKNKIMMT